MRVFSMRLLALILVAAGLLAAGATAAAQNDNSPPIPDQRLNLRVSWGHQSRTATEFYLRLLTNNVSIESLMPVQFEPGEGLKGLE
ncbi:MAG TPA: hypothetical protein VJA21_17105, partial [Verrucomicrobiae bacterium]